MPGAWIASIIVALLGAGGLGAFLQTKYINRKLAAEAKKIVAEADVTLGSGWQVLVLAQRQEINEFRERIVLLERREAECLEKLEQIRNQARQSIQEVEARVLDLLDREIKKKEG